MARNIYDSMAEGVTGAGAVVVFMTEAYERSENCRLECQFTRQSGVALVPVIAQARASGWQHWIRSHFTL